MSTISSGQSSEVRCSGESSHSIISSANHEVPTDDVAAKLSKPENGTRFPLSSLTSRVVNANHQSVAPSQMESLFAGSRIGDIQLHDSSLSRPSTAYGSISDKAYSSSISRT